MAKLEALGVAPKKSLGQNFLVSLNAIEKIVHSVSDLKPNNIVEVGPGLGSLTESLLKLNRPLLLLELDRAFAEYWRQRARGGVEDGLSDGVSDGVAGGVGEGTKNGEKRGEPPPSGSSFLKVVEGDALRWDWNSLPNPDQTVLVSNLPYQIAASLVMDRSVEDSRILKGMVLMFQKEVAERITAPPRSEAYGLLSVIAQNFWDIKMVLEAGPKDFYPAPKIASRVLRFQPKTDWQGSRKNFLRVVKAGFAQRRKFLISNLKGLGGATATDSSLRSIFEEISLSPQVRAEALALPDWRRLTEKLFPERVPSGQPGAGEVR